MWARSALALACVGIYGIMAYSVATLLAGDGPSSDQAVSVVTSSEGTDDPRMRPVVDAILDPEGKIQVDFSLLLGFDCI
jgi:hypothetical protein